MQIVEYQDVVFGHLRILAFSLPVSIFSLILALRMGFFQLPAKPFHEVIPLKELVLAFILFLGSHLLIQASYLKWFPGGVSNWAGIASMLGSTMAILLYTRFGASHAGFLLSGHVNVEKVQDFFFGVWALAICYPLVITVGQIIRLVMHLLFQAEEVEQIAVQSLKSTFQHPILFAAMVFCVTTVVPVVEEILFRGYFQNMLRKSMGAMPAICFSSLVFAFFHFSPSQGLSNIELLASLFILSLFLGFAYEKKRSLWAPIGMHMVFNTINVIVLAQMME